MGYGKEVPPPAPLFSHRVSLEVSQDYILLKGLDRADISGGGFVTKVLCGHDWFLSMLATLPKDRRDSRLLWLENTYGQVGEPGGDCLEPRHEFWYPGFVANDRKTKIWRVMVLPSSSTTLGSNRWSTKPWITLCWRTKIVLSLAVIE